MVRGFFRENWWRLLLIVSALVSVGVLVYLGETTPGITTKTAIPVESFQQVQRNPDAYDGRWVVIAAGSLRYLGPGYFGRMETAMSLCDSNGEPILSFGAFLAGVLPSNTVLPAKIYLRIDGRQVTATHYELILPTP